MIDESSMECDYVKEEVIDEKGNRNVRWRCDYNKYDWTYVDVEKIFGTSIPTVEDIELEEKMIEEATDELCGLQDKMVEMEMENQFSLLSFNGDGGKDCAVEQKDDVDENEKELDDFFKKEDMEYKPLVCKGLRNKRIKNINIPDAVRNLTGTFFEPLERNRKVPDNAFLSSIPYIDDSTDYTVVAETLNQHYYEGIHGVLVDKEEIDDLLLFEIIKKTLPGVVERESNPDAFYYALYKTFPNKGSQQKMSKIFPSLCKRYSKGENLDSMEPWKVDAIEEKTRKFVSYGNYFTARMPLPDGRYQCSSFCFKDLQTGEQSRRLTVYLKKGTTSAIPYFMDFLNDIVSSGGSCVQFCTIAKKYTVKDFSITCRMLWLEIMKVTETAENLTVVTEPEKDWKDKENEYRLLIKKHEARFKKERSEEKRKQIEKAIENGADEKELKRLKHQRDSDLNRPIFENPCAHFGPCGPNVEMCSCTCCTTRCQCDIYCPLRFPGCRCPPGKCRTEECNCVRNKSECCPEICKTCLVNEEDESISKLEKCRNYVFTRGESVKISVKQSKIAGLGAFVEENVKNGQFIGEYTGEQVSEAESERRGQLYKYRTNYLFQLSYRQGSIDATRAGSKLRFLNHKKKPNCDTYYRIINGEGRIGFTAKYPLREGLELTFDYGYSKAHANELFKLEPKDRAPKLPVWEEEKIMEEGEPDRSKEYTRKRNERECDNIPRRVSQKEVDDRNPSVSDSSDAVVPQKRQRFPIEWYEDPNKPSTSDAHL